MKYPPSSLGEWLTSTPDQPSTCELMPTVPIDEEEWKQDAASRKRHERRQASFDFEASFLGER